MAKRTKFSTTARALLLLALLSLILGVPVSTAKAQEQAVEYPFGGDYQIQPYVYNMTLVLSRLGKGTDEWVIPAHTKQSYNRAAGNFTPSDGFNTVYGVPGAGACDVATMLYHFAKDSGILIVTANRLDHPKINGVPLPAVTIWDPGSDLFVENPNDFDVTIKWDLESHPGFIKFWVEKFDSDNLSASQPSVTQPIIATPLTPADVVQSIRWDVVGYTMFVALSLLAIFRQQVILGVHQIQRNKVQLRRIHEVAIRESLQYWAVVLVGAFMVISDLQRGFDTWLYGYTTVKNTNLMLLLAVLLATLLLKSVRGVRLEREWRTGIKTRRRPVFAILLLVGVIALGSTLGTGVYVAPKVVEATSGCEVSSKFPQEILQWCPLITSEANKNGLDPDLVAALILQESSGQPEILSHQGAVGLMQVMPRDGLSAQFLCDSGPCFRNRPSIMELKDPDFNVTYGTRMLAALIRANGQRDGLKSYGPSGVGYYYADIVLGLYEQYRK